jgi:hypothetical protein
MDDMRALATAPRNARSPWLVCVPLGYGVFR